MFISDDNYLQDLLNLDINAEKSFYLQPIHLKKGQQYFQ